MSDHELLVRYRTTEDAAGGIDALTRAGIIVEQAEVVERSNPAAYDRREASGYVVAPVVPMSGNQARGAWAGTMLFGLTGAGVGAVVAFALMAAGAIGWPAVFAIILATTAAGSAAGFVLGGAFGGQAEAEQAIAEEQPSMVVRIDARDEDEERRAFEIALRTGATPVNGPS